MSSWYDSLSEGEEDILDHLDGFQAYESGCTDSGIHHPSKREEIRKLLNTNPEVRERVLNAFVEMRSRPPYGFEDVEGTLKWLYEDFGLDRWS